LADATTTGQYAVKRSRTSTNGGSLATQTNCERAGRCHGEFHNVHLNNTTTSSRRPLAPSPDLCEIRTVAIVENASRYVVTPSTHIRLAPVTVSAQWVDLSGNSPTTPACRDVEQHGWRLVLDRRHEYNGSNGVATITFTTAPRRTSSVITATTDDNGHDDGHANR
jgi:hypothetical protein